ncbi:MAG: PEGA domain-containing protein [Kofleriaceae bacterium]
MRWIVGVLLAIRVAHAGAPTFAVELRSKDKLADKLTFALADKLRSAGAKPRARYHAVGTHKDFVAALDGIDCDVLEAACAAQVGAKLHVDYVLVGTLDVHGAKFLLELSIVSVDQKKRVRSFRDIAKSSIDAGTWATRVFDRAVDDATGGLAIVCNVSRAQVFVDGEPATELYQGHANLSGLALGTHRIELRADGYADFATDVDVEGDNTPFDVLLQAR